MASGEEPPQLSVVLSTLGNHAGLKRVLDGYSAQTAPAGAFEVLVAVDIAEPEPEEVDRAIGQREYAVRKVSPALAGLSANRNAGWRAARSLIVLFTDNDTIPVPRLVEEHLDWHRRHPELEAAIVGKVRWAPEVKVTTFMRWLDTGLQFNFTNMEAGAVPWGCFVGANSSLKRPFIDRVGDFEEQRLPYGAEDTEFAYRADRMGMKLFYNDRAVVDHLRTMSFDFYEKRIRRAAASERELSLIHPELPPWWHTIFSEVAKLPPVRGRGIALEPFVPRWVPWLGPRVWRSVDMAYKQALAPLFLAAWDEAATGSQSRQPDLEEFSVDSSSGSEPGGPK